MHNTFHIILLAAFVHVSFAEDCWNYPAIEGEEDYFKFVEECKGQSKLGFENDYPWIFNASLVTEWQFNKLFGRVRELRMSIYIQNTDFVKPKLRNLEVIHVKEDIPSFRIENNAFLRELRTPEFVVKTIPADCAVQVYYYGNGRNAERSDERSALARIFKLCPVRETCHVAKDSECSRIDKPIKDVDDFLWKCSNKKVIKGAPGVKLELDLAQLSGTQILHLFNRTRDIFMCVTATGTYHRKIRFPNLVHIEACEKGENALLLENNPFLERVILPCVFTSDKSFRIRGNVILNERNIKAILATCLECDIQDPGELPVEVPHDSKEICEMYPPPKTEEEYIQLAYVCSGVKKLRFAGSKLHFFDACKLEQPLFEELFKKVEEVNFGINIVNTMYSRLYLPNLKLIDVKESSVVIRIENNKYLEHLISHYNVRVTSENVKLSAKVIYNPLLTNKFLEKWNRRFCEELDCITLPQMNCEDLDSINTKLLVKACSGQKRIKPREGVELHLNMREMSEEEINDFFEELEEAKMCIVAEDTEFEDLSFPRLHKLESCSEGEIALDIINNKKLINLYIPRKLQMPVSIRVQGNQHLSEHDLRRLRKSCLECDIQES